MGRPGSPLFGRVVALAVSGGQQVGAMAECQASAVPATARGLWSGTTTSWVDLHPSTAVQSFIFGTDSVHEVGQATLPRGQYPGD